VPNLNHRALYEFVFNIFFATGIPKGDAQIIARHLVDSHLYGHDSHGTWLIPNYVKNINEGYSRWEDHEIIRERPSLQVIDAKGANGIVAVTHALDTAISKAKDATFGFVGLHNTTHIGRLGDYPPKIAEKGMIGMVWLNGGGVFMAPFGSADRRLRPEPIAFSAPRRNAPPFMLDMTMTVVAGGKIEQKHILNKPLPEGWLIDDCGNPVTEAERYKSDPNRTAVPPLGGLQFGHKGYGLGMMVEMLVGPLSRAGCTKSYSGTGGGTMVLAINIEDFIELTEYENEVEGLARWVSSAKPLPGVDKIYTPGELEEETYAKLEKQGINLSEPTWKAITRIATELGIDIPSL